jgi:hypothetical protein
MNIHTYSRLGTAGLLGLMIATAPLSVAFARENEPGDDRGNNRGGFLKSVEVRNDVSKSNNEREVQIKNNGSVTLKGAQVTGVSGSVITAQTTLGSAILTWTITTSGTTQFMNKKSQTITLADIVVGDEINLNGTMASGSSLAVNATVVRDVTKVQNTPVTSVRDTFQGSLVTLAGTSTPTTMTLNIGGTNYTVNIPSTAIVLSNAWLPVSLSTFVNGDTVRIFGTMSSTTINAFVVRNATR